MRPLYSERAVHADSGCALPVGARSCAFGNRRHQSTESCADLRAASYGWGRSIYPGSPHPSHCLPRSRRCRCCTRHDHPARNSRSTDTDTATWNASHKFESIQAAALIHHAQAASIYIATTEAGHKKAGDLFRSTGFLWAQPARRRGNPLCEAIWLTPTRWRR